MNICIYLALKKSFISSVGNKQLPSEESNPGRRETYVTVLTFLGGTIFGILLLYIIQLMVRRFRTRRKDRSSSFSQNYENEDVVVPGNVPTYQELNLSEMNSENSNYQSLGENTTNQRWMEEAQESESGYAELNNIRRSESHHYQSLNRV